MPPTTTTTTNEPSSDSAAPRAGAAAILEIAWSRKSLIALGVVIGLVLGLVFYAQATPLYQAKAQILVVKKRPDSITGIDTRNLAIEDFVATYKTLIESPSIIEGAIQRSNLASLECFDGQDDLIEAIQRSLVVTRNRSAGTNNNVLDLAVRTTNSAESAVVLDAIMQSYKDYLDRTYRNISDDMLKLITQGATMYVVMTANKQDMAYRRFRQEAPVLLSKNKDGASLAQQRLSSIEAKRSALLVRKAEIQGYLQAIDSGLKTGGSQESLLAMISGWSAKLEGDMKIPAERLTLNNELYGLLQEEQRLLETRGENHVEVRALQKRIEIARNYLASPTAAYRAGRRRSPQASERPPRSQSKSFAITSPNNSIRSKFPRNCWPICTRKSSPRRKPTRTMKSKTRSCAGTLPSPRNSWIASSKNLKTSISSRT